MTTDAVPNSHLPTRQARGTRRRAELLDATVRLIARAGVAAVTHRAVAAEAGVSAIVQPGGSVRDNEVTAAAEAAGITLYLTGTRHFFH